MYAIGVRVYVSFARMGGVIIGVEYPWRESGDESELWEVELNDGRVCYATSSQLGF